MQIKFEMEGRTRKDLVKALEEITGTKSMYMRMPTCSYQVGDITVEKDGTVVGDIEQMLGELAERGFKAPDAEPDAGMDGALLVSLPMVCGRALKNIINMIYTRGDLINRALGTDFYIPEAVKEAVKDAKEKDPSELVLQKIDDAVAEGEGIRGVMFSKDTITFYTTNQDADGCRAFAELVDVMVSHAKETYRINTVKPPAINDKYEMRTWLMRMGMIGPDYKQARKVLLKNLTGDPSFRTKESAEKAREKMKNKRKKVAQ